MYDLQISVQEQLIKILFSIFFCIFCYLLGRFGSKKLGHFLNSIFKRRFFKKFFLNQNEEIVSLIELIVKYLIYIYGFIFVLWILDIPFTNEFIREFFIYFPKVVFSLLFILIGFMLANIVKKTFEFSLSNIGIDDLFIELDSRLLPSHLIALFSQYLIIVLSVILAISQLGLETQILSWITFSIITLLTFFILLFFYSSIKPFLPDIFAGIVIRNSRYVKIGEHVEIEKKYKMRVIEIGLIMTKFESKDKEIRVRNSRLLEKVILKK